ncbi:MAG: putative Ntn-hydrolase superfamily protein [Paraglaciecola sp.]
MWHYRNFKIKTAEMKNLFLVVFLCLNILAAKAQDTFSIVAVDSITGEVGSAGASCVDLSNFPAFSADFLGELFPSIGAINSQAWYLATNQANARNRMNIGDTPDEIIQWLIDNDVQNQPQLRQYGIVAFVNGEPVSAAHTGTSTDDYKGHNTGSTYSIQGNILSGQEVLDNMEAGFLNTEGDLACKLMGAMQGANMVGADSRCADNGTSSLFAFLKVAQPDDIFGNPSFLISVKTSDGAGIEPIDSLQVLFNVAHSGCSILESVSENQLANDFKIFPNPVSDELIINGNKSGNFQVEIVDTVGKQIHFGAFQQNETITFKAFPKGIYYVKISDKAGFFSQKIVKR